MASPDNLSTRLQEMLRLNKTDHTTRSAASSTKKPLIEIVNHSPSSDDDDEPPPIDYSKSIRRADPNNVAQQQEQLTLAEQMMRDADGAALQKKKIVDSKRHSNASKATFGVKKGFLNNNVGSSWSKSANKKKSTKQTKPSVGATQSDNNLIYELDQDGNMIPTTQHPTNTSSILHQAENVASDDKNLSNPNSEHSWLTPHLLQSIANHPKLAAGMNNPRFTSALQLLQSNPDKKTMERLQNEEPDVMEFITEFCSVMGDHFCNLGEKEKGQVNHGGGGEIPQTNEKVKEMGVLEEKALHSQRKNKQKQQQEDNCTGSSSMNSHQIDQQVSNILSNPELRSILMDTTMQQIMQDCSTMGGNKLQYYMSHEEYGPKLRKLMEAGLLRFA